jgi:hypothetical protein
MQVADVSSVYKRNCRPTEPRFRRLSARDPRIYADRGEVLLLIWSDLSSLTLSLAVFSFDDTEQEPAIFEEFRGRYSGPVSGARDAHNVAVGRC